MSMEFQENEQPKQHPRCFKTRSGFRKILRYLRELSVVVVGIAITFTASGWISEYKEKKTVQRYLASIKTELLENKLIAQERAAFYHKTFELANYLLGETPENHHSDSIWQRSLLTPDQSVVFNTFILMFETTAVETLKSSGLIGRVDEDLSQALLKTYRRLDGMKQTSDEYMERKELVVNNMLLDNKLTFLDQPDLTDPRLERWFYFMALPNNYGQQLDGCIQMIENTLALF